MPKEVSPDYQSGENLNCGNAEGPKLGAEDGIKCQIESPGEGWVQDEDSLDTWFSSWLWAYETMDAETRKRFYPTSVLVTGPDIIFLWVARMIIAGLEYCPSGTDLVEKNIPFRDVYYTGLIRDKQGRKMSKSLGNSPDPIDLINKYGADGVRFGLMRMAPQGQDIRFDEKQIEEGRNFCNKVWNACRFRAMQGPINPNPNPEGYQLSIFCHWILKRLHEAVSDINRDLSLYEFSLAAGQLYSFVWDDFCSFFIEAAKADFLSEASPTRTGTLETCDYVISHILRILHPYAPFLTEELWVNLGLGDSTIQFATWPSKSSLIHDGDRARQAEDILLLVERGRNLRGEFNLPSSQKLLYLLKPSAPFPESEQRVVALLLNASELRIVEAAPKKGPMAITPMGDLFLSLEGVLDPAAELARLTKEIEKAQSDLATHETKLNNPQMIAKAPAEKVQLWREQAEETRTKLEKFKAQKKLLEDQG